MISDQWGQIGWMTIQRIKFITTLSTKLIVGHFIIILYITAKKLIKHVVYFFSLPNLLTFAFKLK